MKRGGAQSDNYAKKVRTEGMDGGLNRGKLKVHVCDTELLCCAGSLADDNKKLEFTLKALKLDDPFGKEEVMHSDIQECLRCPSMIHIGARIDVV